MRLAWIAVVAGCGDNVPGGHPVDAAWGPLTYEVQTVWADHPGMPAVDPKPLVYIDGIAAESMRFEYANTTDALEAEHLIELRHGDVVVYSQISTRTARGCLSYVPDARSGNESWCAFTSGELRFGSDYASGSGTCVGDGFCRPTCFPPIGGCPDGTRCTSIYSSIDPIATHLGCASAGPQGQDQPCTLVTDDDGTHDNCDAGYLCVDGSCKRLCWPDTPPTSCTSCSYVLGHAPEIGVCD